MGHLPSAGVGLLTIDANAIKRFLVIIEEFSALREHTTRTTTGVIDTAFVGLNHLYYSADDAARRVELAGVLALLRRELLQAVFIDAAQQVFLVARCQHVDIGKEIYHVAQTTLVKLRTGIVAWQHTFQFGVLAFDSFQGIINHLSDFRRMGSKTDNLPTGFLGNEEHTFCLVFVFIFHISQLILQ